MRFRNVLITLVIIVIIVAIFYWFEQNKKQESENQTNSPQILMPTTDVPSLEFTETYQNNQFGFSFKHPRNFTVKSLDDPSGLTTVVAQNEKAEGFQIAIQSIDEDIQALTVERIRQDLPDIPIENPQDVILGEHGKGVAFMSDDPAFGGKSREVWFVYDRVLYQIKTYEEYDNLLKNILSTWVFQS